MGDVHFYNDRDERTALVDEHEAAGQSMLHDDVNKDQRGGFRIEFADPPVPRALSQLETEVNSLRAVLEGDGAHRLSDAEVVTVARQLFGVEYP